MPEIVYIDADRTPGQLSGLYAACDCFVAPYRGEGFGLPILEAMACGTVPIVPNQGAATDFVTSRTGYLLPSREVETTHLEKLCGPPLQLEIQTRDLRRVMRQVYKNQDAAKRKGQVAAHHVAQRFTWRHTVDGMTRRIRAIADPNLRKVPAKSVAVPPQPSGQTVAACLHVKNDERELANCLAYIAPFVDEVVIFDDDSTDRSAMVAEEYGARVVKSSGDSPLPSSVISDWLFWIGIGDRLSVQDIKQIQSLVITQPPAVSELSVELTSSQLKCDDASRPNRLQVVRNSQNPTSNPA